MRMSHQIAFAIFLLLAPLIAGVAFETQLSIYEWCHAYLGSASPFGYSFGLMPRNRFLNFAASNYFLFGLPALTAGLLVVRKARKIGAPTSPRYGFDVGGVTNVVQSIAVYALSTFHVSPTNSGWLLLLVLSTLSMAVGAAICTRLTRRWQ